MSEKVGVIDVGSSKAVGPSGVIFNYSRDVFLNPDADLPPMAYIGADRFGQMLGQLTRAVGNPDVIGVTGLGHSIVPIVKNGVARAALVGDDPSLTPLGGWPEHLKSRYAEQEVGPTSAVRKLAGLQQHPELMSVLFGNHWSGEVRYTTLLSLAAMRLLGEPDNNVIFPDEAQDFSKGRLVQGDETVAQAFGLNQDQLIFSPDSVRRVGNKEVWVMQDLRAELIVIRQLFNKNMIPDGALVLATDSVLKRITNEPRGGWKQMEGLCYDTMRMMGNTGLQHILPIARDREGITEVGQMFRFFESSLRGSSLPDEWWYDPRGNENRGQLWKQDGGNWRQITAEEIARDTDQDYRRAVQACGWGMAAGMYQGLEKHETDEVVIYGGLMGLFGTMQPGWKHVFTAAAPASSRVSWLKMPDSRVALEMIIRERHGERLDYAKEVPVEFVGTGGGRLDQWMAMKGEIMSKYDQQYKFTD